MEVQAQSFGYCASKDSDTSRVGVGSLGLVAGTGFGG